jgi:hypothetical protein
MSAAAGAAAAAAIAQAIKACGVLVTLEPDEFLAILRRQEKPLVVHSSGGWFTTTYQYLVSYKGLAFHARSPIPLTLPSDCEVIRAKMMWIPG